MDVNQNFVQVNAQFKWKCAKMKAYAMLEPYIFDQELPAPWNIAGAGFIIGHELGHGFEKRGTKRDVRGGLF